ncbi:MAG: TRAP transporter substrate-binding protein [Acidobacteria bacterium]|nr:TRAP transporter substrate-binding protein [Acidobacteriota bacterium]
MSQPDRARVGRRSFLASLGAAAIGAGCRRAPGGPMVLRISHSMTAGPTSLHLFASTFARLVEARTGIRVRLFSSNTLGQEREVVQQVQEGLVDFMVSGSAIWGSVAPRLQFLDFPFLWRDWDHVHRVVDGPLGAEVSDYMAGAVRVRPLAWGDSFGFRHVVTRSRDIFAPQDFTNLKIRTIQSAIYVKAIELMGASPTPMAFGEVYTSLQTGVIDGYEHDASTTLQQRFYEVARVMTRTRHIAGVLGLWGSSITLDRMPAELRATVEQSARDAAIEQRQAGPAEESAAVTALTAQGMTIREFDNTPFRNRAGQLWSAEARALDVRRWLEAVLA